MDSLTQIVLGAAVGEAVLGKKIGNRALYLGALGGTIPDLDVLANVFASELTALAFHRGFMHGILFAVLAPFGLAWAFRWLYHSGTYRRPGFKWTLYLLLVLALAGLLAGINALPVLLGGAPLWWLLLGSLLLWALFAHRLWRRYLHAPLDAVRVGYRAWYAFWFATIFTHPLLDCFTSYGTQLFSPFSDYRVAFNTISVADPLYTVPFALAVIAVSRLRRGSRARRWANVVGFTLSSAYLTFTVFNKRAVDRVFATSLAREGIAYTRFTAQPTILNNVLWQGVAETPEGFYNGFYSRLDPTPEVLRFYAWPKNHALLAPYADGRTVETLRWFSKDYYNVLPYRGDTLQLNDLRFGSTGEPLESPEDYVFKFLLWPDGEGDLHLTQSRAGNFSEERLAAFWSRLRGHPVAAGR